KYHPSAKMYGAHRELEQVIEEIEGAFTTRPRTAVSVIRPVYPESRRQSAPVNTFANSRPRGDATCVQN
ncbi:hypothetical protein AAVH_09530, partial [Aphelenchoides avenae]